MNQYQPATPRAALAMGALALTALVLELSIVVPASLEVDPREARTAAISQPILAPGGEDVVFPARVDGSGVQASDLVRTHSGGATKGHTADPGATKASATSVRCRSLAHGKAAGARST